MTLSIDVVCWGSFQQRSRALNETYVFTHALMSTFPTFEIRNHPLAVHRLKTHKYAVIKLRHINTISPPGRGCLCVFDDSISHSLASRTLKRRSISDFDLGKPQKRIGEGHIDRGFDHLAITTTTRHPYL